MEERRLVDKGSIGILEKGGSGVKKKKGLLSDMDEMMSDERRVI